MKFESHEINKPKSKNKKKNIEKNSQNSTQENLFEFIYIIQGKTCPHLAQKNVQYAEKARE